MSTNSHFTYSVHILTLLALSEEAASSAYIASSLNTNPVTVRRLVGMLKDAGIVETTQGSQGGAILRKSPAEITLGDIYTLVKDEYPFGLHPAQPSIDCPVGSNIQDILVRIFTETDNLIQKALMKVSIQDILDEVRQKMG